MSHPRHLNSKREKELLELLEQKGSMQHDEIIEKFEKKDQAFSVTRLENTLNHLVENNWIFRIEKDGTRWYRINDFSLEVNFLVSYLTSLMKEEKRVLRRFASALKHNLLTLYPQQSIEAIFTRTEMELASEIEADAYVKEFTHKLKKVIR